MNIVDTHAHIYSEDVDQYPQISEPYLPPTGHGTIEHLKEETERNSINRVVVVQTFTAYQHDNRLLIDTVERNRHWLTGVLNLDPFDIESVEIMKSARQVGVVGNRVSEGWTTDGTIQPEHDRLWSTAHELGMVICALLNPPNCQSLANLLEAYPEVPVVLDHCANLKSSDSYQSNNLQTVLDLAQFSNLYAKLSFLVTGSIEDFPCSDMFSITRQIIEAYTPDRCIWGSDFPTTLWIPKVTYQQHLQIFDQHLNLSRSEKTAILGDTAMQLWFSLEK